MPIQDLGFVEANLLQIEERLPAIFARQQTQAPESPLLPEDVLPSQAMALSRLWLFGLYESMRTYRTAVRGKPVAWQPFDVLNYTLNVVRAPLAKQQVAGETTDHIPDTIFQPATGRVGWKVFDPKIKSFRDVLRIDLADEFLSAAERLIGAGEAEAQERIASAS
jgi:hypothetical protein